MEAQIWITSDQHLTSDLLHKLFIYKDGWLYYKNSKRGGVAKGDRAGTITYGQYYRVTLNRKAYLGHRLIFLMHHGYLPKCIDHINRNSLDNRIENLRETTEAQNCCNQKLSKNNTSGVKGVTYYKRDSTWQVSIKVNRKNIFFGRYKSKEDAIKVMEETRKLLHKEFAYNGY